MPACVPTARRGGGHIRGYRFQKVLVIDQLECRIRSNGVVARSNLKWQGKKGRNENAFWKWPMTVEELRISRPGTPAVVGVVLGRPFTAGCGPFGANDRFGRLHQEVNGCSSWGLFDACRPASRRAHSLVYDGTLDMIRFRAIFRPERYRSTSSPGPRETRLPNTVRCCRI